MTGPGPEPVSPQEIAEERDAKFWEQADRIAADQARIRREGARSVLGLLGPVETRYGSGQQAELRGAALLDELGAALLDELGDRVVDPSEDRKESGRRTRARLRDLDYVHSGPQAALAWLDANRDSVVHQGPG